MNKLTNFKKTLLRDVSNDKSKEKVHTETNSNHLFKEKLNTNRVGINGLTTLRKSIEANKIFKENNFNHNLNKNSIKPISSNKALKINVSENVKTNEF